MSPTTVLNRVAADVVGELAVIGALRLLYRLGEHLAGRVAEWNEAMAQRIDALAGGLGLVAFEQVGDAGKFERRSSARSSRR